MGLQLNIFGTAKEYEQNCKRTFFWKKGGDCERQGSPWHIQKLEGDNGDEKFGKFRDKGVAERQFMSKANWVRKPQEGNPPEKKKEGLGHDEYDWGGGGGFQTTLLPGQSPI